MYTSKEAIGLGAGHPMAIGATALIIGFLLTPAWQHLANRLGVTAQPGPRNAHTTATPTAGGIVVFVALWGALALGLGREGVAALGWPAFNATAAILLLGFVDDVVDLRPGAKLAGQVLAALLFVAFSGPLVAESLFFGSGPLAAPVNGLFALIWLVAMANMFNIIDGLDGLAGGLAVVAAAPLLLWGWLGGSGLTVALSAALIGAVVGFLRYNAHPARLFLGDAGAMLLGFVLGIGALHGLADGAVSSPAVLLLTVAVPLFDTLFAILRRWHRGEPISRADAMHFHHQLLRKGWAAPKAVFILYAVGVAGAAAGVVLAGQALWLGWAGVSGAGLLLLPWARSLGVLGEGRSAGPSVSKGLGTTSPMRQFAPSDPVDFGEETGKFQGIAK